MCCVVLCCAVLCCDIMLCLRYLELWSCSQLTSNSLLKARYCVSGVCVDTKLTITRDRFVGKTDASTSECKDKCDSMLVDDEKTKGCKGIIG